MTKEKNEMLRNGDIIHFKLKGLKAIFGWPNKMRSGIFYKVHGSSMVFTIEDKKVRIISLVELKEGFQYVSSSPKWGADMLIDIIQKLPFRCYDNSDQFIGEILGAKEFQKFKSGDVLQYCIQNGWLSV